MTSYICNNNQCINLDICDRYNNNSAFFLNLYTLFLTFPFIFVYTYNHSIVKNQLNKYISRFGLLVDKNENIKLSKESDISEESNNSDTENEYDDENCEESDDQNCDNEEINEQQSTEEVTKSGWFY